MAQQTVLIDFQVDYSALTTAQEQIAKSGKIDSSQFQKFQNVINDTATDTQGLIKTFKDVGTTAVKMGKTVEQAFGQGIQDALDEAGVSADEFATALKKANAPATSLKKELLALKDAMARMKAEGKDTGKEFDDLRARAGRLQDAISDANQEIKNAGSDTRGIDNVVGSISALAGGYAAVQGAAAIFGDENEDLQKTLVKVNGAMAIATGLQQALNAVQKEGSLAKLADSIATGTQTAALKLYTFVTDGATAATRLLRGALVATGIGAVVILIGSLLNSLDLFGSAEDDAKEAADRLTASIEKQKQALQDNITELDRATEILIKQAKVRRVSESEITKLAIEGIQKRIEARNEEISVILRAGRSATDLLKENSADQQKIIDLNLDAQIKAAEDAFKKQQEFNAKRKKALEDALKDRKAQENMAAKNSIQTELDRVNKELEQEFIHFNNLQDINAQETDDKKKNAEDWDKLWKEFQESLTKSSQTESDKRKKQTEEERAEMIKTINTVVDVGTRVASVFSALAALQTEQDAQIIAAARNRVAEELKAGAITQKAAEARQKQIDAQERAAKTRAAQREKAAAVFTAVLAIPKAFLQGLSAGGPILGAVYAALAAIEAGLIASRPVPKFFRGKKDSYEGPGVVADAGSELVERNGRMYLYTKPTQTYLGAQDKVYTAAETRAMMHNPHISTDIVQPKQPAFDYDRLGKAIPRDSININIDKDFISESVSRGLMRNNYMDRRYSSKR